MTGFTASSQQLGHSLTWHVDKELGSVMSHAQRFTKSSVLRWWPTAPARPPSIRWQLRTGRMTIYLITPADKMVVWAGLQRLWLGSLAADHHAGHADREEPGAVPGR